MLFRRLAGISLVAASGAAALFFIPGKVAEDNRPLNNVDRTTTAVIAPQAPARPTAPIDLPDSSGRLTEGLIALNAKRIGAALAVRDSLSVESLDRHILSWAIALYGGTDVPSSELTRVADELSVWPGTEDLRRNFERSFFVESHNPEDVLRAFDKRPPLTTEGAVTLARAYIAKGDANDARSVLSAFWRSEKIAAPLEATILREIGSTLTQQDHRVRMEYLLYEEDIEAAARIAALAQAQELYTAWKAVLAGSSDAEKLLNAVPDEQRSPGYSFAKIKLLRKADRFSAAAQLMLKAPDSADLLIDPQAWWIERRLLARNLYDAGKIELAYRLVSNHAAQRPVDLADAEFVAGWYALRGLKDPATAEKHFARIATMAEGPISRARAYYWLGRASDAAGNPDASRHYQSAARYGTTFYGQLAADKIDSIALNLTSPQPSNEDRARFDEREAVRAIDRLEAAGQKKYAYRLYLDLARQLPSAEEISLLCERAGRSGNHFIALKIAKAAVQRGIEIGALSHPVGAIPDNTEIAGAGMALAYAVARQESEFNAGAVSGAGALGLLQLMPGTAQETARKTGLAYSQERLTVDPAYNATLGAAVLDQQLQRFGGSYILTFAAYNAGPRRVDQWIARYGDPRGKSLEDIIDWIEKIPFSETRAYVQRVMENYEVYRMRLTGHFDIVSDLTNGRLPATGSN